MNQEILDNKNYNDFQILARQVSHHNVKISKLFDQVEDLKENHHHVDKALMLITSNMGSIISEQEKIRRDFQERQKWIFEELKPLIADKQQRDATRGFFKSFTSKFIVIPTITVMALAFLGAHEILETVDLRKTIVQYLVKS